MTVHQSNYIKLIAIITMFIDHMGVILFPNQILFRIIGRIAFPLFAYQIGVGYKYTKNIKKYILRLLTFGIAIQLFYIISIYFFKVNEDPLYLNIFFTLTIGLISIYFVDTKKYIMLIFLFLIPLILQQFGITLDYGVYGIILILLLFITRNKHKLLFVILLILGILSGFFDKSNQIYSVLAFIFIIKPFNLKIRIPSYVFYLFYPLHLIFLYLLNIIIYN